MENNNEDKIKELEKKLKEKELFINTVLENAPIGFAVNTIDDGKAIFISSKFEEIYGVPRHSLNSTEDFFETVYIDPVVREKAKKKTTEDIMSGDIERMKWTNVPIQTASGAIKYVNATNIPIPEQNLMISTVRDVTEKKLSEDATLEKIEELKKMNGYLIERELKMIELKNQISKLENNDIKQ